ncbi:MAG: hypothetical protein ACXWN0_14450, partial [Isosphaeraceae bacterium]
RDSKDEWTTSKRHARPRKRLYPGPNPWILWRLQQTIGSAQEGECLTASAKTAESNSRLNGHCKNGTQHI